MAELDLELNLKIQTGHCVIKSLAAVKENLIKCIIYSRNFSEKFRNFIRKLVRAGAGNFKNQDFMFF